MCDVEDVWGRTCISRQKQGCAACYSCRAGHKFESKNNEWVYWK
jgi:hypothetical protein